MSRLSFPARSGFVVAEAHGEVLHQPVERDCALWTERPSRGDLLWGKNVEEEAEVRPITVRRGSEVSRGPDRYSELREHVAAARNREGFARERALAGQERRDRFADTWRVGIGHEQPQVVAKVAERLLPLESCKRVGDDRCAARVERVDDQRPHVRMLH